MSRAGQARHVSCTIPGALAPSMRHLHRAKRWRRLGAGSAAKRLPWCRAKRDFFESSAGSPQALSAPALTARRAVQRHAEGVTRQIVWPSATSSRPEPCFARLLGLSLNHARARGSASSHKSRVAAVGTGMPLRSRPAYCRSQHRTVATLDSWEMLNNDCGRVRTR